MVSQLHQYANSIFWPEIQLAVDNECKFWLGCTRPDRAGENRFVQVAICIINFYVWECKLKRMVLGWESCKSFTIDTLRAMCKISHKFNESRIYANTNLSRLC
jgi:hypothetical protein